MIPCPPMSRPPSSPLLPGIGAHQSARTITTEWLTPRRILDVLGPFDLDPCASLDHPGWVPAARAFTLDDDGLHQPWEGRVFLNPPYDEVEPWMARMADHGSGIALVFARCETRWWMRYVWPRACGVLFLAGRVTFLRPDPDGPIPAKAGHNSGGPSVLIAYSPADFEALRDSRLRGALVSAAEELGGAFK